MIITKQILSEDVYTIRHPVLRKGKPLDSCKFKEDDFPSTYHLGAFENDQLTGVVTVIENLTNFIPEAIQYQLRGMAVLNNFQGKGIGRMLVEDAEKLLKEKKVNGLWMNARKSAVGFYEKLGYKIDGLEFDVPIFGPHYKMKKYL